MAWPARAPSARWDGAAARGSGGARSAWARRASTSPRSSSASRGAGSPPARSTAATASRTAAAVRRFQRWAGLGADGVAGPATIARAARPHPPLPAPLSRPVAAPLGDRFGPRGNRFHTGLDFPAAYGRNVRAARSGTVIGAGYDAGGYGNVVHVAHGYGVTTFYAHLSRITVRRGERVAGGERIGTVGSTGFSSGPHLHFELRLRGAMLDPLTGL